MIEVELPDGTIAEFPDGTSPDVMRSALQKRFSAPAAPLPEQNSVSDSQFSDELSQLSRLSNPDYDNSLTGAGLTWMENASKIPVAGPALRSASDFIGSNIWGALSGEDPERIRQQTDIRRKIRENQYPASAISGEVGANIAPLMALGGTTAGAQALGISGNTLKGRALNSALSSAGISAADTLAKGGNAEQVVGSAAISGGIGGAIPLFGAGLSKGVEVAGNKFSPIFNAMKDASKEGSRRVGVAVGRDMQANPGGLLGMIDDQVARANNIPITNVDRGGETTRALARSVANQSPEARATIEKLADDRFAGQGSRAVGLLQRLAGGNADDLAFREALETQARTANSAAYKAAYSDPNAERLYTKGMQELMQSPSFRQAVKQVPKRSADRGAVSGFKEIANPFSKNSQGQYVLRQKANGELIAPNLQFWDHVKRNLDGQIGTAQRAGDRTLASDIMGLKSKLVGEIDTAVPAFQSARQGASTFFGADNAIDAGKKFATAPRSLPEATKAFKSFTKMEREAFTRGYASELVDKIKATSDRVNVINQTFKSPASREGMQMVFGPEKFKQIEAYVRVEDIVDRLRGSMGNSTTARQLMELGIGAGAGGAIGGYNGGVEGALSGAALGAGAAAVKQGASSIVKSANNKTMEHMAKLLTSNDPKSLQQAVRYASQSPAFMNMLERFSTALAAPARTGAIMQGQ